MKIHQTPLRQSLEEISYRWTGARAKEQVHLVAELTAKSPHHIRVITEAGPGDLEVFRSNRLAHAMDLAKDDNAARLQQRYGARGVQIDAAFVEWLQQNRLLEPVETLKARNGDLVIYSGQSGIVHAGRWQDGAVISKWGAGHLWQHGLEEVPRSYGDEVSFYRLRGGHTYRELFFRYAREIQPEGESPMIEFILNS